MRFGRLLAGSFVFVGALSAACGSSSSGDDGQFQPTPTDPTTPDLPSPTLLSGEGGVNPTGDGSTKTGCGNGFIEASEKCDDGNAKAGDGCSATCQLEPGYKCAVPGAACVAAACGDGIVAGDEDCDDGNILGSDGCSSICQLEAGHVCLTPGKPCVATVCGDGVKQGTEQCDDHNTQAFDGCSPSCEVEPTCSGGKCTAVCGDGLKFPGEDCDDGNTRSGDGCSSACKLEAGFTCSVVVSAPPGALDLPIVYRDFLANNYAGTIPAGYAAHPDFEQYNPGLCKGLLMDALDANNKPILKDGHACNAAVTWMTSTDSFKQWYRDGLKNDANLLVNKRIDATLTLTNPGDGSYVFDSDLAPYSQGKFFPIETQGFGVETGMKDGANVEHNFHFTSELKYYFTYAASSSPTLEFRGDDDVWVFINGKLAVDLGGVHGASTGTVTLDTATAATLGLTDGGMYEITVFQAERHTTASNYKLTLSGFEHAHTTCASVCGDGVKTKTEACDDGTAKNSGGYGKCKSDCTLGPRCGDGVVQADQGEQCDDGNLVDGDGCSSTCKTTSGPK